VQTAAALSLVHSLSSDSPGFLPLIVIAELIWSEASYDFKKKDIEQVLETVLRSKELVIERADLVSQALRSFRASRADFVDCLIERCSSAAECLYTVTFDRDAAEGAGMRFLR
jgi:predicted nucleic-acid-binding protein